MKQIVSFASRKDCKQFSKCQYVEQFDKLEFDEGVNDENIIYDWRHDGSGKNNRVPTAKTRFTE